MKRITLEAKNTEAIAFDVADLMARLDRLPDTRDRRGKIYPVGMVLPLIILAKLAGEDKPSGICEWIRLRRDTFVAVFNCQHQRMPCLNTIRWILQEVISEDATRIVQPALARAMTAINNFVAGLAACLGYANLASARRAFDAEIAAQLST